jgi:molybdate transport system ATP-binding protein
MNDGKIKEIGEKEELFNNPRSKHTAILTGCKNISKADKVNDYEVYAKDWKIRLKSSKYIKDNVKNVGLYQDGIKFANDENCENLFRLKIKDIATNPSSTTLMLENKNSNYIYLEIPNSELKSKVNAEHIDVSIDKNKLLLLY